MHKPCQNFSIRVQAPWWHQKDMQIKNEKVEYKIEETEKNYLHQTWTWEKKIW